jgi:hypothetical protein
MAAVGFLLQRKAAREFEAYRTALFFRRSGEDGAPRVTLGKSAAESQAAIDIAQFMQSWRGALGVGARIADFVLR